MKPVWTTILIISLLISGTIVESKEPDLNGTVHRGVLFGFNASTFTGSDPTLENNTYIPGATMGVFQEFGLGAKLLLHQNLTFTTKGSRLRTIGDLHLHQLVTYLELSVLAGWLINPGKDSQVILSGGPAFDLMLLAFNEVGFPEEVARIDLGAQVGIGLRRDRFRVRIQAVQGLLDLDKSTSSASVKNRTLCLNFGFTF